jgi:hypothetical protein
MHPAMEHLRETYALQDKVTAFPHTLKKRTTLPHFSPLIVTLSGHVGKECYPPIFYPRVDNLWITSLL